MQKKPQVDTWSASVLASFTNSFNFSANFVPVDKDPINKDLWMLEAG